LIRSTGACAPLEIKGGPRRDRGTCREYIESTERERESTERVQRERERDRKKKEREREKRQSFH
jgi:hypothetical protein